MDEIIHLKECYKQHLKPREAALKSCPGKSPLEPVNTFGVL